MHQLSDYLTVWTTTRAAAMTSYLLLFASTVAGLLISGRMAGKRSKAVVLAVHQWCGWFGFLFGTLHGMVLVFDKYVGYSPFELLVPFAAHDHRLLNGIGTLVVYISAILILSSDLMKKLGKKAWRAIHFLAFAAFGMAVVHGYALGTDTQIPWVRFLYVITAGIVVLLTAVRILEARRRKRKNEVTYIPPAAGRPVKLQRMP